MVVEAVAEMLGRWHGVERDAEGAVTGFWGLTLKKTQHCITVGGMHLHTWCAWDTLFLPTLLRTPAEVESVCPVSGTRITLNMAPAGVLSVQPREVILSFVLPNAADVERSVTETFCCHVHFLASRDAGEEWAATRPNALLLGLKEGWKIGARKNAAQFGDVLDLQLAI